MPSITFREYHPDSGALLGNISVLDFGKITLGTHSRVKVIDVAFQNVTSVGNIKIGLISSGGITVVNGENKRFGIESSPDFIAQTTPIDGGFNGTNTTGTADNINNVSIGSRSDTLSEYIYLDIEIGSTNLAAGNGAYKVFFDYA